MNLDVEHMWPWLVELVGWTMSRADVGADEKTGYERCKGKRARLPGMEFGEAVLWRRRQEGEPLGKLTCMWEDGIFLGVKGTTGEIIVGDKKGVWRTRTVRRKTIEGAVAPENAGIGVRRALEDRRWWGGGLQGEDPRRGEG